MPTVKNVGEPCAGEPHARFEVAAGGNQASRLQPRGPGASRRPYQTPRHRSSAGVSVGLGSANSKCTGSAPSTAGAWRRSLDGSTSLASASLGRSSAIISALSTRRPPRRSALPSDAKRRDARCAGEDRPAPRGRPKGSGKRAVEALTTSRQGRLCSQRQDLTTRG
jgi:hypothetical protein